MLFSDRREAGRRLAALLGGLRAENPLVVALPRGGLPVAAEVARALAAPLDVLVVCKLGAPMQPELGMGAVAEGGAVYVDPTTVRAASVTTEELEQIALRENAEVERRAQLYRGGRHPPSFTGRTVILVDDGVATGGTARAAIRAIREQRPRRLVLAVPVIAAAAARELQTEVDQLFYVRAPETFLAVGMWFGSFPQTSDDEVLAILEDARAGRQPVAAAAEASDPEELAIACEAGALHGDLGVPRGARGLVLFAHGSGSGRRSPRNQHVARKLREAGLATLLFDLLTEEEEAEDETTYALRFDIDLLARRLIEATRFVARLPASRRLPIGYFGASTGAAAALAAAAELPEIVRAVVSRGGRPDLAGAAHLAQVYAPTLLIVGGNDSDVLALNQAALAQIAGDKRLVVVPGATHLFEEAGALDTVARLAIGWFADHLADFGAALSPDQPG